MNLNLGPTASPLHQWFVLACHGLGLASLWLSVLPVWLSVSATLGLGASVILSWRYASCPRLAQILYREQNWTLVGPSQQVWKGSLLPSTRVGRWLTLLHFRLDNGRFLAVPVWRDSLDAEDYRRMQVVLRWCVRW